MYPFRIVMHGYREWKVTGRYPNPVELTKRLVPEFVADIDYLAELIERGRPKEPQKPDA